LIVYLALGSRGAGVKVPAVVCGTTAALAAGVGVGILLMAGFGYRLTRIEGAALKGNPMAGMKGGDPMMMMKGMGGMKGMGMKVMGMKGKGGGQLSPRAKLVVLVEKIEQMTGKPLAVVLTKEQKAKVADQLKGLADLEALNDDEAQMRLDKLLEVLEGQKEVLNAAGYRWPGEKGGVRWPDGPNPFKDDQTGKSLQSLQEHLGNSKNPATP